jgi:hypothetical protein
MAMYIIRMWLRSLAGFAFVLILERASAGPTLTFFLTGLVFVVLTMLTYGDWCSVRRAACCACYPPAPRAGWTWRAGSCSP